MKQTKCSKEIDNSTMMKCKVENEIWKIETTATINQNEEKSSQNISFFFSFFIVVVFYDFIFRRIFIHSHRSQQFLIITIHVTTLNQTENLREKKPTVPLSYL